MLARIVLFATVLGAAAAARAAVTSDLVCAVQHSIRHREPAWHMETCTAVAEALNGTPRPREMLAVCVLESDLRPLVVVGSKEKPGVYDVGLCGVRCVATATDSSTARGWGPRAAGHARGIKAKRSAARASGARPAADPGVLASRCLVGPARGLTVADLQEAALNVRVASEIMEQKRARHGAEYLQRFNGGTRERGYAGKVRKVEASMDGRLVRSKNPRVRGLVRKIAAVVRERKS